MEDPKVTIGGRTFTVPEFTIKQQRKITPALMTVAAYGGAIEDENKFGKMIDTIYLCLTEAGNEITKDEFENLKMKALPLATEVLPVLLRQAGLTQDKPAAAGPGGSAEPKTPLPGETTSTT